MLLSFWLLLGLLPCVSAAPLEDPFPGILFVDFAKVITSNFGADITLATVLMLLFSVTNNTDLLNLHGQQRAVPTNTQVVTSWMAAFVRAIKDRLQLVEVMPNLLNKCTIKLRTISARFPRIGDHP